MMNLLFRIKHRDKEEEKKTRLNKRIYLGMPILAMNNVINKLANYGEDSQDAAHKKHQTTMLMKKS